MLSLYKKLSIDILEIKIRRKLKFQNYKNYLGATQLDNKIKYLEKTKIIIDSLKKDHEEFIRNDKSILKKQKMFKHKAHCFY